MAGIFHKGIRYSGFGNLWGMIKGNIASQTDLKEALDSIDEKASKDQYIIRNGVTASAGQVVRIPASGYDDRIRNSDGYEAQVVAGSLLSAIKISALRIINIGSVDEETGRTIYSRYAEITLAEGITNTDIGLKITKIGDNSDYLRPAQFQEPLIKVVEGNYPYSLAPGQLQGFNPINYVTIPSGYTGIGIVGVSTNHEAIMLVNFNYANGNYAFYLRNTSSTTTATTTLSFKVLCVKTGYSS